MSGLEVIGVVVGMFPVVTQTINMYKAMKAGRTAKSLMRKLRTEKIIYHEFVRKLVASEVEETEIQKLINPSPDMAAWKDPDLQDKLREKLGPEKAETISEMVQEIEQILRGLNTDLTDIPRGMEMLDGMTERVKARLRTARASMSQCNIYDRLKQLSELNGDLGRLLGHHPLLPRTGTEKKLETSQTTTTSFLHRDCREPSDLYEAISQSYVCSCKEPHIANLGYHCPCCHQPSGPSQAKKHQWEFELVFPPRKRSARGRSASVKEMGRLIAKASSDETADQSFESNDVSRPRPKGRSRSVSVSLENRSAKNDKTPVVRDLCSLVESVDDKCAISSQVLGMIRRHDASYKLSINEGNSNDSGNVVGLEELLRPPFRDGLLRRERMLLAFNLSKAVLQFSPTPWLDDHWSWKDFSVLVVEEGAHSELSHLFVQRIFYSAQSPTRTEGSPEKLANMLSVWREPVLTRLGFALIELTLGCTLRDIREKELRLPDLVDQHIDMDTLLDLNTAFKVLESGRIARTESQAYEEVVRACLNHQYRDRQNAGIKGLNSTDPSFFDNVEESIIMPLYEACSYSGWGLEQTAVM